MKSEKQEQKKEEETIGTLNIRFNTIRCTAFHEIVVKRSHVHRYW